MEISISSGRSSELNDHKIFAVARLQDLTNIGNLLCNVVWSPIIWSWGRRKSQNYLFSDFAVFDFDDGRWSIDDAIAFVNKNEYAAIIGTTKSHQIPKNNNPPCDRFRLILEWEKRVSSKPEYIQNMRRIASHLPCDQQCTDAARMYQPCTEVVFVKPGKGLMCKPYVPTPKPTPTVYQQAGILPRWLQAMVQESPAGGMRNKHIFKLAAKLAEHGYSEAQVVSTLLAAPIDRTDLSNEEITNSAKSGYKSRRR